MAPVSVCTNPEGTAEARLLLHGKYQKSILNSRPQEEHCNEASIGISAISYSTNENAEVTSTVASTDPSPGPSTLTYNHQEVHNNFVCGRHEKYPHKQYKFLNYCKTRCDINIKRSLHRNKATQTENLYAKNTPEALIDDILPFTDSAVEEVTIQDDNSTKTQDKCTIMLEESWSDVESQMLDDTESSDSESSKRKISKKKEVPSAKATTIPANVLQKINWNSYRSATRKLLMAVFPRRVLASHSLTGKPSPAFPDKPAKRRLDPAAVDGIVRLVVDRCRVPESIVRTCITTKCADESKMQRSRQNGNRNKENCREK